MLNHKSFTHERNGPSHYNAATPVSFPITPEDVLKELLEQGRQINDMPANLTILISQYQTEKKHVNTLIKETGKHYKKFDLSDLIANLGSLISVLSNLSEFFASVSAQLYFAFDFFLTELYANPAIYGTHFHSDFVVMEQSIGKSIQSFAFIENKLNELHQSLYTLQTLKHTNLDTMNESIAFVISELNNMQTNFQQNLTCINKLQSNVSQQMPLDTTLYPLTYNQFASY